MKVIGCDVINEYKFPIKHILSLTKEDNSWKEREKLELIINQEGEDFTIWNKELNTMMKSFVEDYSANKSKYENLISDIEIFDFIITNIKHNFAETREREKIIFDNYLILQLRFGLADKKQFAKYGYFHIQKNREDDFPSFFTRIIENDIYDKEKVITVMGYLTKSKVLWDKVYDKNGDYESYTTKAGFGISDYWKEYFKGIKYIKKEKISNQTIYRLNERNSPYSEGSDLVEIKMLFKDYNRTALKGKSTQQFIDYAILISDSQEQIPIEEME
jgi:hypothetical protein